MSRFVVAAAIALAACSDPASTLSDGGVEYCWIHDCPSDPGAEVCGTCVNHFRDEECPPGFVCSCDLTCVKGPRSYDGGVCPEYDAAPGTPDAAIYDWPDCDMRHQPGDDP